MNDKPTARDKLTNEAHLLVDLLEQHVQDRQRAAIPQSQLIYFIDAHELKAYIHANKPDYLGGFVLDAEQALADEEDFQQLQLKIGLKSEQVLQWLLFDHPGQVILLPSHGEEIDEEIAYQGNRSLANELGLMGAAKAQLKAIRARTLPSKLLSSLVQDAESGDENSKDVLLRFLGESAPALAALLRMTPDSIIERIKLLGTKSNLVTLADVQWEDFGFDTDHCRAIRDLRLDTELVEKWRSFLANVRSNTFRANRLDAQAISFLLGFNGLMQERRMKSHGVLVTRAMTLISMVRAGKRPSGLHRDASDLMRHSRLLAISPGDAHGTGSGATALNEPVATALGQLGVALKTYERQLAAGHHDENVFLRVEAKRLVAAWHEFESARFTMELARSRPSDGGAEAASIRSEGFKQALRWLMSGDEDIEALVVYRLNQGVWSFGQETFSKRLGSPQKMLARVRKALHPRRIRVLAIVGSGPGPIEFDSSLFPSLQPELLGRAGIVVDLLEAARSGRDVVEDYLVWALLHGCLRNWNLAEIYADSAMLSARLLRRRSTEDEARLLLAQVLRLGGGAKSTERVRPPNEDRRRFDRATRALVESEAWKTDPRFALESAAQTIERLLCIEEDTEATRRYFAEGIQLLERAYKTADDDAGIRLRIAEMALVYLLAAREKLRLPEMTASVIYPHVREWHALLVASLSTLRRDELLEPEEIPRRACALEIVGYELGRELADESGAGYSDDVPSSIQIDVDELQAELVKSADRTGKLVAKALTRIIERTGGARGFNLVYSPVWERTNTGELFATEIPDAAARAAAIKANKIVHQVGDRQTVLEGDRRDAQRLDDANRLFEVALGSSEGASRRAVFHLHMEHCYISLLKSHAEKDARLRTQGLESLAARYRELVDSYPDSAVLHYRHSIVLSDLGRRSEAFEAIKRALTSLADDPFISKDHWVRSTIVRRMGFYFASEARDVYERLKANPTDATLRRAYLQNVGDAFRIVNDGFDEAKDSVLYRAKLETRRRLNNIVYYAALFLEGGGELPSLAENFDREKMLCYTKRLHNDGMSEVTEWNIAHTIGYVYNVLGLPTQAREAADRLWNLISKSGANAESASIRHALNDALAWKREGETVPGTLA